MQKYTHLTLKTLLFPLAFAFFEVAVYIGNDLVQPAMLMVTQEFNVGAEWAPTSMSAYLLGGALLAAIWGPLSDQMGRRKVFLLGASFFIVCCLAIIFTNNIQQFMTLRVLQGTALTLISAVGFASIQEAYVEAKAVKVMALMANISLLAPLLGPVLGAFMIEHISWHWGFVGIALLASAALYGLYRNMPETVDLANKTPKTFKVILNDFYTILKDKNFIVLAISGPLIALPVMLWIALSPVFLVEELKLSSFEYGLSQIPVFGGLILGNLLLAKWVERFPLGKTVLIGFPIIALGVLSILFGIVFKAYLLWGLIIGMSLIALGEGLSYAVMYRFALMSSEVSKGTVAAGMATLVMLFFASMIELTKYLYWTWHLAGLWVMCAGSIMIFALVSLPKLKSIMKDRALQ